MEYYSFISSFQRSCYEYSDHDDNSENPRCSAILGLWYGTIVMQRNQSEQGCSTTHVTHNLMGWERSSSTRTERRRKNVFGNRNVNEFWTLKSVRRDMTTYSFLGLEFQMAEEDEGKETKFSEPSRMTIMLKKTLFCEDKNFLRGLPWLLWGCQNTWVYSNYHCYYCSFKSVKLSCFSENEEKGWDIDVKQTPILIILETVLRSAILNSTTHCVTQFTLTE